MYQSDNDNDDDEIVWPRQVRNIRTEQGTHKVHLYENLRNCGTKKVFNVKKTNGKKYFRTSQVIWRSKEIGLTEN